MERSAMEDIISNLPRDVINCIFDFLPVRDAARTSILSTKWRYIWASYPHLVLDPKYMLGNIADSQDNDFVGIVNGILLQHIGPILTYEVNVSDVHMSRFPNIDRWILYLSRNGLTELAVDSSSHNLYAIPSYIFLCQELRQLDLTNCIFKRPCGTMRSFHNLKVLNLTHVDFKPKVSASIFTASKLEHLYLNNCSGMGHLSFDSCSSSLVSLVLFKNHGVKLSCFMKCKSITYADLASPVGVTSFGPGERISLTSFLKHWPLISKLYLDRFHLKFLAADSVASAPPVKANCLKNLILFGINFADLEQISCILFLLHSSPGINTLEICMKVPAAVTAENNLVLEYLQERSCMSEDINGLQILMMKNFQGSRAEMLFVKLILACCPSLQMITFVDNRVKASEVTDILKELLLFPRASRKAHIAF